MKAYEHYRESLLYAEKAAESPEFAGALVGALLALVHAVQSLSMQQAMDEMQFPQERAQWRDLWRGPVPPRKCG